MATATITVSEVCTRAKRAAHALAQLDSAVKGAALEAIASALEERSDEILAANERDMRAGAEAEIGSALLDRLSLDEQRVGAIARAVRDIAALPDPVGEVIGGQRLPNGLDVR
jgi:glutamate-5-semialdehyde dehydrogenase